ncbi:MAG TPA: HTH domain-containing protein [Bacillota bacterium]|nr:HTH domain-containing protein [Bacillota bacterium]
MLSEEQIQDMFEYCAPENTIVTFGLSEKDTQCFVSLGGYRVESDVETHMIAIPAFLVVIDDVSIQKTGSWSYEDTLNWCREWKLDYEVFCFLGSREENQDIPSISNKMYLPREVLEKPIELERLVYSVKKRYIAQKKRSITRNAKLKGILFIYEYAKRNGTFTTKELAKQLGISERSVQRYLNEISDATWSLFYDKTSKKWQYAADVDEIEEMLSPE